MFPLGVTTTVGCGGLGQTHQTSPEINNRTKKMIRNQLLAVIVFSLHRCAFASTTNALSSRPTHSTCRENVAGMEDDGKGIGFVPPIATRRFYVLPVGAIGETIQREVNIFFGDHVRWRSLAVRSAVMTRQSHG
jgi:hypothetical protein